VSLLTDNPTPDAIQSLQPSFEFPKRVAQSETIIALLARRAVKVFTKGQSLSRAGVTVILEQMIRDVFKEINLQQTTQH